MNTTTQKMNDIPDAKVPDKIKLLEKDPRYISHKVISQGNGKSTIEVVLKA